MNNQSKQAPPPKKQTPPLLKEAGMASIADLQKALGLSRPAVYAILRKVPNLEDMKRKVGRETYYHVPTLMRHILPPAALQGEGDK